MVLDRIHELIFGKGKKSHVGKKHSTSDARAKRSHKQGRRKR